jgi:hypothetical protein
MCCQPIANSSARTFIFDLDFQFSKPPTSSNASRLGSAARLNLSDGRAGVDVSVGVKCPQPWAGFSRPVARPTSRKTEISNSDDDGLPSLRKTLTRPKQVIDLTNDDDITEVSWLRNTRTARHYVRLTPILLNRPFPDCRPTPFTFRRPRCKSHPHTPSITPQRHLQRPHRREEIPLEECPLMVFIIPQTSTAFR